MRAVVPGAELERWAEERLGAGIRLTLLAGDASTRSYVRAARTHAVSRVLMVTGESLDPESDPWLLANRIVSSVIAGPRTLAQWDEYFGAVEHAWSDEDEALVDSLVVPGHPSTPGYHDPSYPFFGRRVS